MELKSLLATTKEIELDFPDMEGFKVKVAYLSKEQIRKITNKSKTIKFDRKTHQPTEELDEEIFTKLYVEKAVLDWKGLSYEYLGQLVLLDSEVPEDGYLEFSTDNAYQLITNSNHFDSWISNVISDLSLFSKSS